MRLLDVRSAEYGVARFLRQPKVRASRIAKKAAGRSLPLLYSLFKCFLDSYGTAVPERAFTAETSVPLIAATYHNILAEVTGTDNSA